MKYEAPTLVRTYKVKLAYGNLTGKRALIRWSDGRDENVTHSEYLKLVDRALPRDVYKFLPDLKVGDGVTMMRDGYSLIGLVVKLHKNSVAVKLLCDGSIVRGDPLYTFSRVEVAKAAQAWSNTNVRTLKAELDSAVQESYRVHGKFTETPRLTAARAAYIELRAKTAAEHGLTDWKEKDEAFGY